MAVTAGARMARLQLTQLEAEGKLAGGLRYEILNGELVIRGIPLIRHEKTVSVLHHHFSAWTRQHGGEASEHVDGILTTPAAAGLHVPIAPREGS